MCVGRRQVSKQRHAGGKKFKVPHACVAYKRAQRIERAARASFLRLVSDHSCRVHTMQGHLVPKHVARAGAVGEKNITFVLRRYFFFELVLQKQSMYWIIVMYLLVGIFVRVRKIEEQLVQSKL